MNPELENLVQIALVDGYITDKEKEVLKRKAQNLGFDVDELEMILEGKLYELNKTNGPKVNKCPNCGQVISGLSKVCPSCDYVLTTEKIEDSGTLQQAYYALEQSIAALKSFNTAPAGPVITSCFKIVFTAGLYIIYKKLIKKEPLFDRFTAVHQSIIYSTDAQAETLLTKYGASSEVKIGVQKLIEERDALIKKRQTGDAIAAAATFAIMALCVYFITLIPAPKTSYNKTAAAEKEVPQGSYSDQTEQNISEKHIAAAKKSLAKMTAGTDKEVFTTQIRDLEIDSLVAAKNFNAALDIAGNIPNTDVTGTAMQEKVNMIIEKEVDAFIADKDFTRAREKAALAVKPYNSYLKTRIDIAAALEKDKNKSTKQKK